MARNPCGMNYNFLCGSAHGCRLGGEDCAGRSGVGARELCRSKCKNLWGKASGIVYSPTPWSDIHRDGEACEEWTPYSK